MSIGSVRHLVIWRCNRALPGTAVFRRFPK